MNSSVKCGDSFVAHKGIMLSLVLVVERRRGAYHGLTEHFAQANLNPEASTWWDVYNFNNVSL
jgi:hypothetical protein